MIFNSNNSSRRCGVIKDVIPHLLRYLRLFYSPLRAQRTQRNLRMKRDVQSKTPIINAVIPHLLRYLRLFYSPLRAQRTQRNLRIKRDLQSKTPQRVRGDNHLYSRRLRIINDVIPHLLRYLRLFYSPLRAQRTQRNLSMKRDLQSKTPHLVRGDNHLCSRRPRNECGVTIICIAEDPAISLALHPGWQAYLFHDREVDPTLFYDLFGERICLR